MTLKIIGEKCDGDERLLTPAALDFIGKIAARFSARREQLLDARIIAQEKFDRGELPGFLAETTAIRKSDWQVSPPPPSLEKRHVEITAPAERKMIIYALNSAADCYMADLEDSLSPTWRNIIGGHSALLDAARGECELQDAARGKVYKLNPAHECELIVRPRGWHLPEKNVLFNGRPISASLFDFALFFYHGAQATIERGRTPCFYLPKVEHWREAELWDEVMAFCEDDLRLPKNTAKATLLIETLPACFQMHEILHAMRGRLLGLNCGRWDYLFSYIKTLNQHSDRVLPERHAVGMAQPLMTAYSLELIRTCHLRGAHAMGGMSAFVPIRDDETANALAMQKVREDKQREAKNGHDGTWVAHPDLIPMVNDIFAATLKADNQKNFLPGVAHTVEQLLAPPTGNITLPGLDNNIHATLRYLAEWLAGRGAVPIFNLMEDAATAEIGRSQLWQWLRYPTKLADGDLISASLFEKRLAVVSETVRRDIADKKTLDKLDAASDILTQLTLAKKLESFMTLKAYPLI